jgi:hypothetical protein
MKISERANPPKGGDVLRCPSAYNESEDASGRFANLENDGEAQSYGSKGKSPMTAEFADNVIKLTNDCRAAEGKR